MQPIGKKLIGSFYQSSYTSTGETSSSWNVIHLPEDDFIGVYGVADAAGDNAGNHEPESPLHFSFDSTIQVLDNGKNIFQSKSIIVGKNPMQTSAVLNRPINRWL